MSYFLHELRLFAVFLILPGMFWIAGLLLQWTPNVAEGTTVRVPPGVSLIVGRNPKASIQVLLRQFYFQALPFVTVAVGLATKYLLHMPNAYQFAVVYVLWWGFVAGALVFGGMDIIHNLRSHKEEYVYMAFYSDAPWRDRLGDLVRLLDRQLVLRPEQWDRKDPEQRSFVMEDLPEMQKYWNLHIPLIFRRRTAPQLRIEIAWFKAQSPLPSAVLDGGVMGTEFLAEPENVRALLEFAKDIFVWGDMTYGIIYHPKALRAQTKVRFPYRLKGMRVQKVGWRPHECLPGVLWANFFGKRYVDWFGDEKMRTAPCYAREKLPGGGVLLLTSASPLEYAKPEVKEFEQRLLIHLGEDAFFSKKNSTRPCRSPFRI